MQNGAGGIVAVLLVLGGCGVRQTAPAQLDAAFMADGWAAERVDCESDGVMGLEPDGTWSTYGGAGTWRMVGNSLVLIQVERGGDVDEEPERLDPPQRSAGAVTVVSPDRVRIAWAGGDVSVWRRCTPAELGPAA